MKLRIIALFLCCAALLTAFPAAAAEEELLFSGESAVTGNWSVASDTTCTIDFAKLTPGSGFCAEYSTSREAPAQIYLAINGKSWINVHPTATVKTENGYIAWFGYDNLLSACGGSFAGYNSVCLCSYQPGEDVVTTFYRLSWVEEMPVPELELDLDHAVSLFVGSGSADTAGGNLTFFYTAHVGGKWDAAAINEGSSIYIEYTGTEVGVYLGFASASGATPWAAVYPDVTVPLGDGKYASVFSYANFSNMFGENFARLDQIQAYALKNEHTVLNRVCYIPGSGTAVDTSDGAWLRPDTGIAFIGDSIVQNPLVDTQHLGGIDWNGILGRTDCSNYGIGGQTTRELVKRIDALAAKDYHTVVFLCGINDIGRNLSNAQIVGNYRKMITALREKKPDIRIFILSVLPTESVHYTDAQNKIVGLNTVLQVMAQQEGLTFVDCHSTFVGEDGYCKKGLTFDGLHPNLEGYAIIADILNPLLDAAPVVPSEPEATEPAPTEPDAQEPEAPASPLPYILIAAGALLCIMSAMIAALRRKKQ